MSTALGRRGFPTSAAMACYTSFMECKHAQACESLLARILELHVSGHTASEIAAQILTTEPENAMFRAALLVEMIIHCVGRPAEEKNP